MNKEGWKKRIEEACNSAGTYRREFDSVIDTLAGIMEKRDAAEMAFEAGGSEVIVEHTNKGGAVNIEQNPIIRLINDLNRDALAYWRDLGLTPAGLKRINEMAVKTTEKESALEAALKKIGGQELENSKRIRGKHTGRAKAGGKGAKAGG